MKTIAITTGDPAGIGPEVVGKGLQFYPLHDNVAYIIYGHIDLPAGFRIIDDEKELDGSYRDRNKIIRIQNPSEAKKPGQIYLKEIKDDSVVKGQSDDKAGEIAYQILTQCVSDVKAYGIDAVLTGPVSKQAIQSFDSDFMGHTEFFAREFSCDEFVMNFVSPKLNIALLTTHCSLDDVRNHIDYDYIIPKLRLIHKFAVSINPEAKIALLGVNPHCGEGGLFGEDEKVLNKSLYQLRKEGIIIDGPFPADSFFRYYVDKYDQVISTFHDQGLIPLKLLAGETGVNTTLGLPFLRTSVDHGTAFDIAGKGIASETSFDNSLLVTEKLLGIEESKKMAIYSRFAEHYDEYMSHVDTEAWTDFVLKLHKKYRKGELNDILDIACGTGSIAIALSDQGYHVDAIDKSPDMLKIAAKKKKSPHFYQSDFLTKLPANSFDLVVSLFDSVNYLSTKRELTRMFGNVKQSLKDNGLYIFDVSTEYNSLLYFDNHINLEEGDNTIIVQRSEYNRKKRNQEVILDIFTYQRSLWEHHQEKHDQKIHELSKMISVIDEIPGLSLLGLHSFGKTRKLDHSDPDFLESSEERIFFVVKKKS
jgi:4-phospho-D-threonate 3-dehydrogenase / 4-phospho-D-erythronate 3-dehydrogenase